jgi:glycosyltransferase involved in cell wall biosynthesis
VSEPSIALIMPRLDGGGIERVFLNLATEFCRRGLAVDLIVGERTGELADKVPKAIRCIEIARGHPALFLIGLLRYWRHMRPSHVLSAFDDVNAMTMFARLAVKPRSTLAIGIHNSSLSKQSSANGWRRVRDYTSHWSARLLCSPQVLVVTPSAGIADEAALILGRARNQIRVIPNPVFDHRFREAADRPIMPQQTSSPRYFIAVGRLHPQKRIDLLLRAFAIATAETNIRLRILGSGTLEPELRSLADRLGIRARVDWEGFVSNPAAWLQSATALVLTSDYEGFGNVLVEAMACGTQVIATDCPSGPAEILEGGRWGQLVPVGSVEAIATAMRRCLNRESWIEPQKLRKRATAFSVEVIANRYLSMLGLAENCRGVTNDDIAVGRSGTRDSG